MISTEERAPAPIDADVSEAVVSDATRPTTGAWLAERISTETGVLMGAVWYVLFMIASGLEPATDEAVPAWSVALSLAFLAMLAVMAAGLIARRRWGLLASLGAAGMFTAFSVACPVSGHHALAPWWFGQMACALGLVGASVFALTRPRA